MLEWLKFCGIVAVLCCGAYFLVTNRTSKRSW